MREIKFRYWYNNKLYPALTLQEYVHNGEFAGTDIDDCILMQFTGLLDKQGKEIYEGDVLLQKELNGGITDIAEVIYSKRNMAFECKFKSTYLNLPLAEYIEVIGNIYENPDLIK